MTSRENSLPVIPTVVPQARKYTRTFNAAAGVRFTGEDTVTIEIPPINNTYLTKDAKIYFKFNLSFYEHSFTSTNQVPASWFGQTAKSVYNIVRKPVPMLESCGAYSFIRDVEVYDYLGGTLLEKTLRHDLLASIISDYYLDEEVERLCPTITENQNPYIAFKDETTGAPNYTMDDAYLFLGESHVQTKVNGINLLNADQNGYTTIDPADPKRTTEFYEYIQTPPALDPALVKVPTWLFSIDLLNFLGKGTSSFVPLHNGFRIVLKLNPSNLPVKFGLPSGGLTMKLAKGTLSGSGAPLDTLTIVPNVTEFSIFDIKLRAELLEITPDLDAQVDKSIRTRMNSYQLLGPCKTPTIIPGNYLSVNSYKISMRHLLLNEPNLDTSQIGFRSRTFVDSARLLYNGAVQQEYKTVSEFRHALGGDFDPKINTGAFTEEIFQMDPYGTSGYLYPYPNHDFKVQMARVLQSVGSLANWKWFNWNFVQDDPTVEFNTFYTRYNNQAGKFLIHFDLSLNGYSDNTITGIDTTKTTITLDLDRPKMKTSPYASIPWETDVFINHDAIITIKPGQSSSVSF